MPNRNGTFKKKKRRERERREKEEQARQAFVSPSTSPSDPVPHDDADTSTLEPPRHLATPRLPVSTPRDWSVLRADDPLDHLSYPWRTIRRRKRRVHASALFLLVDDGWTHRPWLASEALRNRSPSPPPKRRRRAVKQPTAVPLPPSSTRTAPPLSAPILPTPPPPATILPLPRDLEPAPILPGPFLPTSFPAPTEWGLVATELAWAVLQYLGLPSRADTLDMVCGVAWGDEPPPNSGLLCSLPTDHLAFLGVLGAISSIEPAFAMVLEPAIAQVADAWLVYCGTLRGDGHG